MSKKGVKRYAVVKKLARRPQRTAPFSGSWGGRPYLGLL